MNVRIYLKRACSKRKSFNAIAFFSSTCRNLEAVEKAYYVTTPIFYVNDAPHIGHLHSMVVADIIKRWQVLKGRQAFLCTGTDEHGMKVQHAAKVAKKNPQDYCDSMAETYKLLAERANISNDHFVRTTDPSHKDAVQHFWTVLRDKNLIYESKHEGWYCISDETFYPEGKIEKRLDPFTGRAYMASQETGKEVEWTSERNYHFKLSELREPLLKFYEENPEFVLPKERMDEVVSSVRSGLEDLSISRPADRSRWGIQVPCDESQVIYVWLDALINYISKAKYPWPPGQQSMAGWPADVHVIGKDIVRFHCIYWPAFLLAAGIKPPKQILSHAHWTLGKKKMSKSTGNVVNPFFAIDRFGVDTIRYYLALEGGILNDSDYGNINIVTRYKRGLQGGLGNLLFRLSRPLVWNVRLCIKDHEKRRSSKDSFSETENLRILLQQLPDTVSFHMDQLNVGKALYCIMKAVHQTNTYFQDTAPWKLTQSFVTLKQLENRSDSVKPLAEIIYHCAESLRIVGILLQPFMPGKSADLLDMLCVYTHRRSFTFAKLGADFDFGNKTTSQKNQMLFPMLPVEK
ncbi:putative methionine--tRNA ligase, mitochondrial [Golovinomyces cichoracearum]|uniref:Probable methionine--tRNA ligase, mitochondrial n=1 Tax=Golovinomyces cichoracearum TaxID=62708 RepID=A0A420HQN5_9PEZI|nr:putative methionine--tRNA ligase, mitochondrial [Golovinomyces cichoracearum]